MIEPNKTEEQREADREWEQDIREQCKWDEYISRKLEREDREARGDDDDRGD